MWARNVKWVRFFKSGGSSSVCLAMSRYVRVFRGSPQLIQR